MKLEIGKEYVTRNGLKVKIYDIAESGNYPVVAGVHVQGKITPTVYTINGTYSINIEHIYDIIGEWQEPLDFDWECLPAWCNNYIAMDEDGIWFAYSKKPTIGPRWSWVRVIGGAAIFIIPKDYAPKNFKCTWEESIFKNPNK